MSRSKFFRLKLQKNEILNSRRQNGGTDVNAYKRRGEDQLSEFEAHIKTEIARKTETASVQKWTYPLLQCLALDEVKKPPFKDMDVLKTYLFTNRYCTKFMVRNNLNFSSRKSDQKSYKFQLEKTGIQRFATLDVENPGISDEYIEQELNERLEELELFEESGTDE